MKQADRKRIAEIDYLRGFGCLAVIGIHVVYDFVVGKKESALLVFNMFMNTFFTFAIPLFIFISGFVLFYRYNDAFPVTQFYKKRAISILPPYIIFSVLYTLLIHGEAITLAGISHVTPGLIIKNIILGRGYYHLWFFVILIQFYLLYPAMLRIYNSAKSTGKESHFIAFCFLLQLLWNIFSGYVLPNLSPENFLLLLLVKILKQPLFFAYILYFALGIAASDHYIPVKEYIIRKPPIFFIAMVILLELVALPFFIMSLRHVNYFQNIPHGYAMLGAPLIIVLNIFTFALLLKVGFYLLNKQNIYSRFINEMGRYSFGIYLIHAFILQFLYLTLSKTVLFSNYWVFEAALYAGTVFISYAIIKVISGLPKGNYIVGGSA